MRIEFGSIEYFELLSFADKLKLIRLDRLGLTYLDALRTEISIKIEAINKEENEYRIRNKKV